MWWPLCGIVPYGSKRMTSPTRCGDPAKKCEAFLGIFFRQQSSSPDAQIVNHGQREYKYVMESG